MATRDYQAIGVHQVHPTPCGDVINCNMRIAPWNWHVAHWSRKPRLSANVLVAHVALAPQVEFELLKGMQQQNTSWTRHQVVSIVFKEIVQLQ